MDAMQKLLQMRQRKTALVEEVRGILDKAEAENRDLNQEEENTYSARMTEIETLKKQEARHIQVNGLEDEIRNYMQHQADPNNHDGDPAPNGAEKRFGTFGEQLLAVARAYKDGEVDQRLRGVNAEFRAASGLSEGVPADGGFLVQTDFATELLKKAHQTGLLSSRCRRIQISSNANSIKINRVNETSRADGSRWGGVRAYWAAEAAEKTKSQPEFGQMELSLKKLIGLCYATDELLQDAMALESVISQAFPEEFGFKMDDAIVNGSGAGQPLGIMTSGSLVTVAKETGQAAATIVPQNIAKMWSRMFARSRANAVWLINQDIEPQLNLMSLPVGTGGVPVYLPAGGLSNSPYASLMGRPVLPIEQCQTLGTTGDIILADLSQYMLAEKGGIQTASSIHVRFVYDESVFRFVYRVDGQPTWNSALTPFKGTNTQSPFVVLATRS